MQTKDVAELANVATSTIRFWTTEEYRQYFTPNAQGDGRRRRVFTDRDARVICFIAQQRIEGAGSEAIHAALKVHQAQDWRNLPELPAARVGDGPVEMMPREAAETTAILQKQRYLREIARLEDQIDDLNAKLDTAQGDRDQLQRELMAKNEVIGELRGRLAVIETERPTAARWLRWMALAALVAALVSVAVAGGVWALLRFG